MQESDFQPTAIILTPANWYSIQIRKAGGTNDAYVHGDPATSGQRLWGLPVVVSNKLNADTFVLGDFPRAGAVYRREGVTIHRGHQTP